MNESILKFLDPLTISRVHARPKPSGLPIEVAQLLADALSRALSGHFPMMKLEQAMRCVEEASKNGVAAAIVYEVLPESRGRHVLVVDELRVVIERGDLGLTFNRLPPMRPRP